MGANERDRLWSQAAISGEMDTLVGLPDENINKDGSAFFGALLRLAAVTKGGGRQHTTASDVLESIKGAVADKPWIPQREVERQWKNAYNLADPRYRQNG